MEKESQDKENTIVSLNSEIQSLKDSNIAQE
jgi:hypothetical protein